MAEAAKKEHYEKFDTQVFDFMTRVEAAYEHARKQKNNAVVGIWDVMRHPEGNRLAKFFQEWRKYDILEPDIVANFKKWIEDEFDMLIKLEEEKKK